MRVGSEDGLDARAGTKGIRHRTLLSFVLGEMDRDETHFDMAYPTLTTCISHRPYLYTKPFPLAQLLVITDKLLQNKFIIFNHFPSSFHIIAMIMEAPINLFL